MTHALITQSLGRWGEECAVAHIEAQGWRVLERNWRCKAGEIDIIARDPRGVVVFIEVKTRRRIGHGTPLEAVTEKKHRTINQVAMMWLKEQDSWIPNIRIDVIGILVSPPQRPVIRHIKGLGSW